VNAAIARLTDVPAGILAGCDRLVHPAVADQRTRERQRRFIGVMLAAPLAAGGILALSPTNLAIGAFLALLCGLIAICWMLALSVSLTGRNASAERFALGLWVTGLAVAGAAAGSSSPLILLAAAIGFETWWIGRSRSAAFVGIAAAAASLGLYVAIGAVLGTPAAGAGQAWQWLPPILYAMLSWPRVQDLVAHVDGDRRHQQDALESHFDLPVLQLSQSGEITGASEAAARAFGLPGDVLVGSMLLDRVHLADRIAFMSAVSAPRNDAQARSLELRLRVAGDGRAGGIYVPFAVELAPAADHWMLLLRDASEMTELRAELAKARDAAESIDLAKSRFLAAVSHELRTPLNSIIGFSDMLMHGIAGEFVDSRQRDYVGLIRQSGTHLLSVVNAILDVSKIESGAYSIRPELFAVKDAVELCHSMMAQQAREKGLTLTSRILPDPGEIKADRRAVQQIVLNLMTNAIKFTPTGGSVTVEAVRHGSRLRIVVADTGIGIAEKDLQRLGRPFMQVRNDFTRQFDGAGLGLSLVKGLVKLHEGDMSIESAPGEGTVVTVTLPLAGPKNADAEMAEWDRPAALHRIGGSDETVRKSA